MKKIITNIKNKKSFHYIIIAIIGILISIPLIWLQIRSTDDGWLHILRLIGIDNSLNYGSFPFLIQPFYCNDWGYSMTSFYPTIVSYIPYLLGIIVGTFTNGIKIFAALTVILSGIFMYKFMIEVTDKKRIGLLAAIIYMCLPYRLEDIYNRFAIGEFTAFVFMPLVFLGLYNLTNKDGKKHYYLAIGAIGLILSHTISTLYTAIFCLIYILLNIKEFLRKDVIIKCFINLVFILLVTAIFWVPLFEFKSSARYAIFEPDIMRTNNEYTADNAIEFWQFFKDKEEENGVSFIIGIPFIIMLILGIFTYRKLDEKKKNFYLLFILFGIISIFMCTKYFPWSVMPDFLCTLQYPWRMLGFAIFFLTPLCAINIYYLTHKLKERYRDLIYILVILIIAIYTITELYEYKSDEENLDYIYEENTIENSRISYFAINRDYMPYNAIIEQNGYLLIRSSDTTLVLKGNAIIGTESKDGLYMEIEINQAEEGTELELPYLYYPGYTVTLTENNEEILLEITESENGFLKVTMPTDIANAKIVVEYTGTTLEKVAYITSGISLIIFIIYILYFNKRNKNICMINEGNETNES